MCEGNEKTKCKKAWFLIDEVIDSTPDKELAILQYQQKKMVGTQKKWIALEYLKSSKADSVYIWRYPQSHMYSLVAYRSKTLGETRVFDLEEERNSCTSDLVIEAIEHKKAMEALEAQRAERAKKKRLQVLRA